jgi:hypothetical protein
LSSFTTDGRPLVSEEEAPIGPKLNGVQAPGVKLDDALHSQFGLVAALDDLSMQGATQRAVQQHPKPA